MHVLYASGPYPSMALIVVYKNGQHCIHVNIEVVGTMYIPCLNHTKPRVFLCELCYNGYTIVNVPVRYSHSSRIWNLSRAYYIYLKRQ